MLWCICARVYLLIDHLIDSPIIFRSAGFTSVSSALFLTGVFGVVKLVSALAFMFYCINKKGNRFWLTWGSSVCGVSMLVLGKFIFANVEKIRLLTHLSSIFRTQLPTHRSDSKRSQTHRRRRNLGSHGLHIHLRVRGQPGTYLVERCQRGEHPQKVRFDSRMLTTQPDLSLAH